MANSYFQLWECKKPPLREHQWETVCSVSQAEWSDVLHCQTAFGFSWLLGRAKTEAPWHKVTVMWREECGWRASSEELSTVTERWWEGERKCFERCRGWCTEIKSSQAQNQIMSHNCPQGVLCFYTWLCSLYPSQAWPQKDKNYQLVCEGQS